MTGRHTGLRGSERLDERLSETWRVMLLRSLRLGMMATGAAAGACFVVALGTRAWSSAIVLASTAGVAAMTRWVLRGLPHPGTEAPTSSRLAEAALTWLAFAASAAGATVALATTAGPAASVLVDPWGASFEAVSGITTTGLTMVSEPDALAPTLQLWRSVLQAVGTAGVVAFALQVAEPSGDRDDELGAEWGTQPADDPQDAARRIMGLYLGIATAGVVGLVVAGDPVWRALNHALTAAATGGFAITNDSAAASTPAGQGVLAVVGFVAATSFATLWGAMTRTGPPLRRRTQVRTNLVVVAVLATTSVSFALAAGLPLGGAVFNALSASATSGFNAGSAHQLVPAVAFVTILAMLIGGAAGSTAGGIKVARLGWIAKSIAGWLPDGETASDRPWRWDGRQVAPDEGMDRIVGAGTLIAIWIAAAVIGTVALAASTGAHVLEAGFEAVSAASGTGLSSGLTAHDLGWLPKATLVALMLGGRLEFTAFLALAARAATRR